MKEKNPVKVLQRRLRKLGDKASVLSLDLTGECLHAFRVEVKKLMALIRMLNTALPEQKQMKAGRNLKTIYHFTGLIRNLELQEERVARYFQSQNLPRPCSYLSVLDDEKRKAQEALKESLHDFSLHDLKNRLLDKAPDYFDTSDCRRYLSQQKNILAAVVISSGDEKIHEARRTLKDIGYNRKHLHDCMDESLPALCSNKEETDKLTESLGNFQDLCMALGFLESHYLKHTVPQEKKRMLQLQEKLEEERKTVREQLIQRLMAIFQ